MVAKKQKKNESGGEPAMPGRPVLAIPNISYMDSLYWRFLPSPVGYIPPDILQYQTLWTIRIPSVPTLPDNKCFYLFVSISDPGV
jgi:hypothetical protein